MNFNRHSSNHNKLASYCCSFGNATRVAIIEKIAESDKCVNNEIVEVSTLSETTVASHLLNLKREGIIKGRVGSGKKNYCIDWDKLDEFKQLFDELYARVKKHQEKVLCNNDKCE